MFQVGHVGYDYKRTLFSLVGSNLFQTDPEEYFRMRSELHLRSANRLLRLCQDNGGCFIKVGQHIAALDYLLPEEYVQTMKPLRANAPEMCLRLNKIITCIRKKMVCLSNEILTLNRGM